MRPFWHKILLTMNSGRPHLIDGSIYIHITLFVRRIHFLYFCFNVCTYILCVCVYITALLRLFMCSPYYLSNTVYACGIAFAFFAFNPPHLIPFLGISLFVIDSFCYMATTTYACSTYCKHNQFL